MNIDDYRGVHGYAVKRGLDKDLRVENTLLDAYAKCDEVGMSRNVSEEIGERDSVSWNSMIAVYAQNGLSSEVSCLSLDDKGWRSQIQCSDIVHFVVTLCTFNSLSPL
ncbi:pentatricopeptide repeat-containing protein At2g34400-like [Manihot esculenta]|uniref:pentatricopeptide repeat-containing protein At2g34400-like n=1 Tax=Manihot esculenta TaxID=3983 RepID=UPI001CC3C892|nr:pentatricopeptide repeat-containing protein At2g34400-like [Manihot esculenta]